jgi:hypothetical protein
LLALGRTSRFAHSAELPYRYVLGARCGSALDNPGELREPDPRRGVSRPRRAGRLFGAASRGGG